MKSVELRNLAAKLRTISANEQDNVFIYRAADELDALAAAPVQAQEPDYSELERQHLGDPDEQTGIYAQAKPLTRSEKNRLWSSCSEATTLLARVSLFGSKIEQYHGIKEQS